MTTVPLTFAALNTAVDPADVSPGLLGFIPVFLIALACIGLFLSLTSKLRKVNRKQAALDAEEALAAGQAGASTSTPTVPSSATTTSSASPTTTPPTTPTPPVDAARDDSASR